MKTFATILALLLAAPVSAQIITAPVQQTSGPVTATDPDARQEAEAANAKADKASSDAANAMSMASAAMGRANGAVRTVNTLNPVSGNVTIPSPDLSGYALTSQLPDLSAYALKSAIPSLSGYAKLSDIPAPPDLSPYALKTAIPSLTGYARLIDIPPAPDLTPFATATALAGVQSQVTSLQAVSSSFVNNGVEQTVASLKANQPCASNVLMKYARVSDLWQTVRSVMICETDGTLWYWRPVRTDYAVTNNATGGTYAIIPLQAAPVQIITSTLISNVTFLMSNVNAWPGATYTFVNKGILGLFNSTIGGLIGGTTLPLPTGNTRTVVYTAAGWQAQ